MDYNFSKIEPLVDSVNGRPISKIVYSKNLIVIELASDEMIEAIKKYGN